MFKQLLALPDCNPLEERDSLLAVHMLLGQAPGTSSLQLQPESTQAAHKVRCLLLHSGGVLVCQLAPAHDGMCGAAVAACLARCPRSIIRTQGQAQCTTCALLGTTGQEMAHIERPQAEQIWLCAGGDPAGPLAGDAGLAGGPAAVLSVPPLHQQPRPSAHPVCQ